MPTCWRTGTPGTIWFPPSSLADLWQRHFWDSRPACPPDPAKRPNPGRSGLRRRLSRAGAGGNAARTGSRSPCTKPPPRNAPSWPPRPSAWSCRSPSATPGWKTPPPQAFDVVTARACAPLPKLLGYAQQFTGPNSVCLFLKGQNVGSELTEAHKSWKMKAQADPKPDRPFGCYTGAERAGRRHDRTRPKNPASWSSPTRRAASVRPPPPSIWAPPWPRSASRPW